MRVNQEAARKYIESIGLMSLLCLLLLGFRAASSGTTRFSFIPGNLALAWAALLCSWALVNNLQKRRWLDWQNLCLSAAWLFFLPNTWYVLTDFLHVDATGEISQLFDIVLVGSLVLTGFSLGFTSLYLIHKEFARRLSAKNSWLLVELVILLSSFAVYLGRVQRWNSWDVLANPSGLIINVSDRVVDPLANLHAWDVTGLFFVLISICYLTFWRGLEIFEPSKSSR